MSDQEVESRAAELERKYKTASLIPRDTLCFDTDGDILNIPPPPVTSADSKSLRVLSSESSMSSFPPQSLTNDTYTPLTNYSDLQAKLELVFPLYIPHRNQLIRRATALYEGRDIDGYVQLLRDLIYVGAHKPGRNDRSRSRTRTPKPAFEQIKNKLLALKTARGNQMLTEKWVSTVYHECQPQVLEAVLHAPNLGDLSHSLRGRKKHEINRAIINHLKTLNQWLE